MTDKKEGADKDAGRTTDAAGAKRPYATLDLKAMEVKTPGDQKPEAKAGTEPAKDATSSGPAAKGAGRTDPAAAKADGAKPADTKPADAKVDPRVAPAKPGEAAAPAARKSSAVGGFFTHLAAGIVGGFLALLGADTIGPKLAPQLGWPSASGQLSETTAELQKRVAQIEAAARKPAGDDDLSRRVAGVEQRLALLDEMSRTVGALGAEQSRIAADTKALSDKLAQQPGDGTAEQRVTRLEERLRELSTAAATDPQSGKLAQLAGITGRLSDLESSLSSQMQVMRKSVAEQIDARMAPVTEASEAARAGTTRIDRDLAQVKTDVARVNQRFEAQKADTERNAEILRVVQEETGQLRSSLDGLKGEMDNRIKTAAKPADVSAAIAPLAAKIAGLEGNVQNVVKSEDARRSNAERVVLSLELANLKRVVERGQPFAAELAEVKKAAGGRLDLGLLERVQDKGVATLADLQREFRPVADRIIDAAGEPSAGGVVDRLLAGAKSVVRVRKTSYSADDTSPEATVARIEAALKEGQLGRALELAKALPAGLAALAQPWQLRAEARQSVDNAIAAVEGQLKASLAGVAQPGDKSKN